MLKPVNCFLTLLFNTFTHSLALLWLFYSLTNKSTFPFPLFYLWIHFVMRHLWNMRIRRSDFSLCKQLLSWCFNSCYAFIDILLVWTMCVLLWFWGKVVVCVHVFAWSLKISLFLCVYVWSQLLHVHQKHHHIPCGVLCGQPPYCILPYTHSASSAPMVVSFKLK